MAATMKVVCTARPTVATRATKAQAAPAPKAAFVRIAQAAGVSITSLSLAAAAFAGSATVKLGADNGALVFDPATVTIGSGDSVTFVNNAGFPHNVVFDEDAVPSGVNAEKISQEDYLNAPGEKYTVTLKEAGTYEYYCEPHKGAGMAGKIIVK